MIKKEDKYLRFISIIFHLFGWGLLFYFNWMIGLGAFLVIWGQNINKGLEMGVYKDIIKQQNGIIKRIIDRLDSLLGDKEVSDISSNGKIDNN